MFAVPGWNVSAKLLASEQTTGSESSVKRKRPKNDTETSRKIEGAELERLWNQRFGEQQSKKKKKTRPKKQHPENVVNGDGSSRAIKPSPDSSTKGRKNGTQSKLINTATHSSTQDNDSTSAKPQTIKDVKRKKQKSKDEQPKPNTPKSKTDLSSQLPPPPPPPNSNLTPLQLKMRSKLTSARFRHLNQQLYTTPSSTSLSLFQSTPSLFAEYHAGFTQQVQSSWPTNPVDTFIANILTRSNPSLEQQDITPLPRRKTGSCTITDLGCGDAPLSRHLSPLNRPKKLNLTIHSYDLHAPNTHVTVADIASLPLRDGEADVAIFCLSLMGTNWLDFIEESWRVLRGDGRGELWVAEVKSRFGRRKGEQGVVEHSVGKQRKKGAKKRDEEGDQDDMVGAELFASSVQERDESGDETDIKPFVAVLERRGFKLLESSVDKSNKMFVSMTFHKNGVPSAGKYKGWKWNGKEYAKQQQGKTTFTGNNDKEVSREEEGKVLKPCVYKSR